MPKPLSERFWDKVDFLGPIESHMTTRCWLWTAAERTTGYGMISVDGTNISAHRVVWELSFGPIPEGDGAHGTCVLHRCDNRLCVRPEHLFLGTNADNIRDMAKKGRMGGAKGTKNHQTKLTDEDILAIRSRYARGSVLQRDLAVEYGVQQTLISGIVRGVRWAHIGVLPEVEADGS